jgi:hypothetical protein
VLGPGGGTAGNGGTSADAGDTLGGSTTGGSGKSGRLDDAVLDRLAGSTAVEGAGMVGATGKGGTTAAAGLESQLTALVTPPPAPATAIYEHFSINAIDCPATTAIIMSISVVPPRPGCVIPPPGLLEYLGRGGIAGAD